MGEKIETGKEYEVYYEVKGYIRLCDAGNEVLCLRKITAKNEEEAKQKIDEIIKRGKILAKQDHLKQFRCFRVAEIREVKPIKIYKEKICI